MNYTAIKYYCTVNGPGTRTAVFVAGCNLHCEGCFNEIAWNFKSGKVLTDEKINEVLDSIEPSYIRGLSILGGEPMDPNNQEGVSHLIDMFRERFGDRKTIWMWSGYYVNKIPETNYTNHILSNIDTLIDGPFVSSLYDREIKYAGSSNQHVLSKDDLMEVVNVKKS